MKKTNNKNLCEGFSLVELIITIAIMAILVGIIAIAVIPNIQRSRESKDLSQLDSIASAANTATANTKAEQAGVIKIGTTSGGVEDVTGFDSISSPTEAQVIKHTIYQSLPEGAGKTESSAIGSSAVIALAYDVSSRKIQVAYVSSISESATTYAPLTGLRRKYLDQDFFVANLS